MTRNTVFSGGLKFFSLADIFQILGGNNSTGTLKLISPCHMPVGYVYFVNGSPVNAVNGIKYGTEAIYAMFGWMDGRFEFYEESVPVERAIKAGRMKIVLDALRLLDEGVIKKVGATPGPGASSLYGFTGSPLADDEAVIYGPPVNYAYFIDEERYFNRDQIVLQGKQCHGLRVILEGTVEITRETSDGSITLSRLGQGSFIGTFNSFTYPKSTRSATATAVGDVYLGILDYLPLYFEYSSLPLDFRKLLTSLSDRLIKISNQFLNPADETTQTNLSDSDAPLILEKDTVNNDLFTITEGKARLFGSSIESDQPLVALERNDVFGALPFLRSGNEPYCSKIIGSKDLKTLKNDPDDIMREYDRLPIVFQNMIQNLCMCIKQTTGNCLTVNSEKGKTGRQD